MKAKHFVLDLCLFSTKVLLITYFTVIAESLYYKNITKQLLFYKYHT